MSSDNSQEDEDIELVISEQDRQEFKRFDQFLANKLDQYSRSFLKTIFLAGNIEVSNKEDFPQKLELKKMPPAGSIILIDIPPPLPSKAEAENIPIQVLYEDEYLLFINKPAGMVTHPAPGNYTGTLVNAILFHCQSIEKTGHEMRPGIVHRLDKGTSGVMVVAKTRKCHEELVILFSKHEIERVYQAITIGKKIPPIAGTLEGNIGRHPHNRLKMAITSSGRRAVTDYKTVSQFQNLFHMTFKLETGRTHQIRVHTSSKLNMPILLDPTYGNPKQDLERCPEDIKELLKNYEYPLLHARKLGFIHPITKKYLEFEVDAPEPFYSVLKVFEVKQ